MIYFFKPLPEREVNFPDAHPFIKNKWFNKNYMKFVYALQILLVLLSIYLRVWDFLNWYVEFSIFCMVFLIHESLHVLVIYGIGDISITHSGVFFWINSDGVMSKKRFWLFMTLPLLVLTIAPVFFTFWVKGLLYEVLRYIAWINAIIAGSDIINSVLIAVKPSKAEFYRGYYRIKTEVDQGEKL